MISKYYYVKCFETLKPIYLNSREKFQAEWLRK
uniref:Uncharacterized protein n=1 Tax=Siphoviridae sp. ctTBR23 TaxID=2825515 RepID=A0A8S5NZI4_9CAUD|nr:MAG TPA: hypothetical protein [Siphoviridae sp. ctTBR23]